MVKERGISYDYIHLISGQDLPLKTQDYIHSFFDNLMKGTNLVGFAQGEFNKNDLAEKTNYYHLFIEKYRHPFKHIRWYYNVMRRGWLKIQKLFRIKRKWTNLYPKKGCSWVSITPDFCSYLLEQKSDILKEFRGVPCADEIYKQTMIYNSPFRNTIYDLTKDFAGMTRKIDWIQGSPSPYTWLIGDIEKLIQSDALFARKFSSIIDKEIIDEISVRLKIDKLND